MTGPNSQTVSRRVPRATTTERQARERRGRAAEWVALLVMRSKGYKVLARRVRTGCGEIDLVAVRRRRLVFVEVKRRKCFEDAEAAVTDRQRRRIRKAADLWLARHPDFHEHSIEFDLILIAPRNWPRHIKNGL